MFTLCTNVELWTKSSLKTIEAIHYFNLDFPQQRARNYQPAKQIIPQQAKKAIEAAVMLHGRNFISNKAVLPGM